MPRQSEPQRLQSLLKGPLSRLLILLPSNLAALDSILEDAASTQTNKDNASGSERWLPTPLKTRPPVGTEVMLIIQSKYLHEYHNASYGSKGVIVAHSKLMADDDGVLVAWGVTPKELREAAAAASASSSVTERIKQRIEIGTVRCNLNELSLPY